VPRFFVIPINLVTKDNAQETKKTTLIISTAGQGTLPDSKLHSSKVKQMAAQTENLDVCFVRKTKSVCQ